MQFSNVHILHELRAIFFICKLWRISVCQKYLLLRVFFLQKWPTHDTGQMCSSVLVTWILIHFEKGSITRDAFAVSVCMLKYHVSVPMCSSYDILADIRCGGTNIHAPTLHSAHHPWYILEIITETNRIRIPRIPKKNKIHHRNYSLTVRGDACEIRAICFVTHCRRQNLLTTEGRQ